MAYRPFACEKKIVNNYVVEEYNFRKLKPKWNEEEYGYASVAVRFAWHR